MLEGLAEEAHYAISVTPRDRCHASGKLPILPHSSAEPVTGKTRGSPVCISDPLSKAPIHTDAACFFLCSCNCFTRGVHEMENDKSRRAGRKRITSRHRTNNPPLPSAVARGARPTPGTMP